MAHNERIIANIDGAAGLSKIIGPADFNKNGIGDIPANEMIFLTTQDMVGNNDEKLEGVLQVITKRRSRRSRSQAAGDDAADDNQNDDAAAAVAGTNGDSNADGDGVHDGRDRRGTSTTSQQKGMEEEMMVMEDVPKQPIATQPKQQLPWPQRTSFKRGPQVEEGKEPNTQESIGGQVIIQNIYDLIKDPKYHEHMRYVPGISTHQHHVEYEAKFSTPQPPQMIVRRTFIPNTSEAQQKCSDIIKTHKPRVQQLLRDDVTIDLLSSTWKKKSNGDAEPPDAWKKAVNDVNRYTVPVSPKLYGGGIYVSDFDTAGGSRFMFECAQTYGTRLEQKAIEPVPRDEAVRIWGFVVTADRPVARVSFVFALVEDDHDNMMAFHDAFEVLNPGVVLNKGSQSIDRSTIFDHLSRYVKEYGIKFEWTLQSIRPHSPFTSTFASLFTHGCIHLNRAR
jgi:hypothetical protein